VTEPSHDTDVERGVIGAALYSAGRVLDDVALTADDFFHPAHAELWSQLQQMRAAGEPIEAAAVLARSDRKAIHAPIIAECVAAATSSPGWYADQLRLHTAKRRIQVAGVRLQQLATTTGEYDVAELVELARGLVDEQTHTGEGSSGTVALLDALVAGFDRWSTPDRNVLPTGWVDLDDRLNGGLRPGHLVVIGARPAVGKSLVATELAANVAATGNGVLFASLEMSANEVVDRIAASRTKVALHALSSGHADEEQLDKLSRLLTRAAEWPLHIDDRAGVGISAIRGRARDLTRTPRGLGLVIVDYLQLIAPADRRAPREQQVASISRGLKLMAKDLQVPVVALSQVNRGPSGRENKRPTMSDLRESGAIEADADEILLLHRDDEKTNELEMHVAKNRHGTTGLVELGWHPYTARITNITYQGTPIPA
jgi:replicative DNA helicase